jgi:epoxyqueuosine reductase
MPEQEQSPVVRDTAVADNTAGLATALKAEAQRLGFDLVGIAPAVTPTGIHAFLDWLERGYAGQMAYLERREEAYQHPRHVLDGARSVVMLGINYSTRAPVRRGDGRREEMSSACERATSASVPGALIPARIARYALGQRDYHDVIREKLHELAGFLRREAPGSKARGVVDTAPLLERDFARLAGLGWFGKNTMLINKHLGSWFFLAGLLVDLELEYDAPHAASHCGTCTRCLDACPTNAFVAPYVLDSRRCISYLTIEHRGPIPAEFHAQMGDWLFGCDICQEVCPWNHKAPVSNEPAFQPQSALQSADAAQLMQLTEEAFHQQFGHTALARAGRAGLIRNAAILASNAGSATGVQSAVV